MSVRRQRPFFPSRSSFTARHFPCCSYEFRVKGLGFRGYSLNSLKGLYKGATIGVIKGDTRSLDYGSYKRLLEAPPKIRPSYILLGRSTSEPLTSRANPNTAFLGSLLDEI